MRTKLVWAVTTCMVGIALRGGWYLFRVTQAPCRPRRCAENAKAKMDQHGRGSPATAPHTNPDANVIGPRDELGASFM